MRIKHTYSDAREFESKRDWRTITAPPGEKIDVDDETGRSLTEQEGWENMSDFGDLPADDQKAVGVRPEEVVRQSVRALRTQRGWSQKELAEKLKAVGYPVSKDQINRLEDGARINVNDLFALGAALNVAPVHLLAGSSTRATEPVSVTSGVPPLTRHRLRGWIRGHHQLPKKAASGWDSQQEWARAFHESTSDEDWLILQRTTVQLIVAKLCELVPGLHSVADRVDDAEKSTLDRLLVELVELVERLDSSDARYPSARPGRTERRGRPRSRTSPKKNS